MELQEYIGTVSQKYRASNATEHTYRGALEQLMQTLLPKLRIVNEPKREKCGAPDYIASRKDGMPVFYIEAKNIGDNDLDGRNPHAHKEQFTRYKQALDHIIFTDYLDFHLYEHGEFIDSVRIAEVKGDMIAAIPENKDKFINLIEHVGNTAIQRITSASRLAKLMAGKARLLANIISQALNDENRSDANDNLYNQYLTFKEFLIQEVYLTNSLEESNNEPRTLFAQWLSREATEANVIKRDYPVMVMIGNPPYSISSQNNGRWITNLIADYKKDLNERNIQPLSDDYIKFIRLGQHYIEKNGEGVLAFICNNSFTDGIIHRQMRKELMRTFDKIYILDLHGNSRKKETAPDGSKDENVFDIMQGVSINIFIKKRK